MTKKDLYKLIINNIEDFKYYYLQKLINLEKKELISLINNNKSFSTILKK